MSIRKMASKINGKNRMIRPMNVRDRNIRKRLTINANSCLSMRFEPIAISNSLLKTLK
jgi:hypothetical protein